MDNEEHMSQLTLLQPSAPAALPAVTFVVGGQEYSLPVADVLEIVPVPALLTKYRMLGKHGTGAAG